MSDKILARARKIFPVRARACIIKMIAITEELMMGENTGTRHGKALSKLGASKGGKARARALTKEQRSDIARHAVEARWIKEGKEPLPRASHDGEISIGNLVIPCAVLDSGERVLSERGVTKALGGKRGGSHWLRRRSGDGANLPVFVSAKNLKPFIGKELSASLSSPIIYVSRNGGARAHGFRADLLPRICDIFLRARNEEALTISQQRLAKMADIIIRGLAHVGIIALVDEATGYQADRARDALAKILEAFVAKELRKWVKTFPSEFYKEMFRLKGLPYDGSCKKPQYVGHYTNDLIYARLAPGVLNELRQKNPIQNGRNLKSKHHQWLTKEIGHPRLLQHIASVTVLMRACDDWSGFYKLLERSLPKYISMPLWDIQGVNPK